MVWSASGWIEKAIIISDGLFVWMEVMSCGMRTLVWSLFAIGISPPSIK